MFLFGYCISPARPTAPLWLLLPIVVVGAALGFSWLLHIVFCRASADGGIAMCVHGGARIRRSPLTRSGRPWYGGDTILVYALREHKAWVGFSGVLSLLVARLLTFRNETDKKKWPIPVAIRHWLLALAVSVGLLLIVVTHLYLRGPRNGVARDVEDDGQNASVRGDRASGAVVAWRCQSTLSPLFLSRSSRRGVCYTDKQLATRRRSGRCETASSSGCATCTAHAPRKVTNRTPPLPIT